MSVPTSERRRLQRVRLLEPLPGKIEAQRVFILDISRSGVCVAHQQNIGGPGEYRMIQFEWDGRPLALECRLTHSRVQRVGGASYSRTIYHSGFVIVAVPPRSADVLREMLAWHVERALDEQKANARGIPAIAAQSYQTGKANGFIRHVFAGGRWHEIQTTDGKQPMNGFTISSSESAEEVHMLRAAWETGDHASRMVIRKMAELSISRLEGIPTRRYMP